jgi:hypothetical protein
MRAAEDLRRCIRHWFRLDEGVGTVAGMFEVSFNNARTRGSNTTNHDGPGVR